MQFRRVDLRRGLMRGGYAVTGVDRVELFDSAMKLIASEFGVVAPSGSLAEVSTGSPIAYRLYEEGLRAFYQFDGTAANQLLHTAIQEDSMFAMATYYAWRSAMLTDDSDQTRLAGRVLALSSRASTRDRLLMETHVRFTRSDPLAVAMAESLATQFSNDPEALIRAAEVISDMPRVTQLLNRSIELDSAADVRPGVICRLCDALNLLQFRYAWADSSDAVGRSLERWQSFRPNDAAPWCYRADWLVGIGRRVAAEAALRRCEALGGARDLHLTDLIWSLRSDDVDRANPLCAAGLTTDDAEDLEQFRWYCTIGLRMQGRYREAVALARRPSAEFDRSPPGQSCQRQQQGFTRDGN